MEIKISFFGGVNLKDDSVVMLEIKVFLKNREYRFSEYFSEEAPIGECIRLFQSLAIQYFANTLGEIPK